MRVALVLATLLAAIVATPAPAGEPRASVERKTAAIAQPLLDRAGAYAADIARVEASPGPVSLEPIVERASALAAELKPILEALLESDCARVRRDMKGFVVNREEVILLEPDSAFFSALARRVGTDQDRAYFDFTRKVAPEGFWPVYIVRQTDVGGCTDYGSGKLSQIYAAGTATASKLGSWYRRQVEKTLHDIASHLTESTCACGDLASVQKELRAFLRTSPDAPPAAAVRTRLAALERGDRVMRPRCVGGI